MLGPNHHSYQLAKQTYGERLSHSARIRMIQKDRSERPFNHDGHRLITARRLAAGIAGVVLTFALAAARVGSAAAAPNGATGGGVTLVR